MFESFFIMFVVLAAIFVIVALGYFIYKNSKWDFESVLIVILCLAALAYFLYVIYTLTTKGFGIVFV